MNSREQMKARAELWLSLLEGIRRRYHRLVLMHPQKYGMGETRNQRRARVGRTVQGRAEV